MTMIGQAGRQEIKPVLLLHASAGFPFGLDQDGSIVAGDAWAGLPDREMSEDLVAFASLDTATSATCRPESRSRWPSDRALVIVDDWAGHDHALRNFVLLFVQHRLLSTGFQHVRFLVTSDERPPEGWRPELDVHHQSMPIWKTSHRSALPAGSGSLCLMLDRAATDSGIMAWAEWLHRDRGVRVVIAVDPEASTGIDVPAHFQRIENPVAVWPWLSARLDVLGACDLVAWQQRMIDLAQQSGVRTADVATAAGRAAAAALLEQLSSRTDRSQTRVTAHPVAGDWLRQVAHDRVEVGV